MTGIGYAFGFTRVMALKGRVLLVDWPNTTEAAPGILVQGGFIGGMSGGPVVDMAGLVVSMAQQSNSGVGFGVGTLLFRAFLVGTP